MKKQTQNPKDKTKDREISDPKIDQQDPSKNPKPIVDKPEKVVPQEASKNDTVEDSQVPADSSKKKGETENLNIAP